MNYKLFLLSLHPNMQTNRHTNFLILILAMLISIATVSVVSIFTTQYAEIVCQAIEADSEQEKEHQKPLISQISALNIHLSANNTKLPTVTSQSLAKRVSILSNFNSQLLTANAIILNSLRENNCSNILSYSHCPPLYYIFALNRMRN